MDSLFDPSNTKAVVLGLLAAFILRGFYRAVSSEWPRHYFSAKTTIEEHSRRNFVRYATLRLAPVLIFCIAIGVIALRTDATPSVSIIVFALAHWSSSTAVAIFKPLRHDRAGLSPLVCTYHVASTAGIVAVVLCSLRLYTHAVTLVPSKADAINAIWTAALAAIFFAALKYFLQLESSEATDLMARARRDIGDETWSACDAEAADHATDPTLLRAIISAEALQRPRWARRLEFAAGRVVGPGTYGVAQMQADRPISDRESVCRLAASFSGCIPMLDEYGYLPEKRTKHLIRRHNSRPEFVDQVLEFYHNLIPQAEEQTEARGGDGRARIEVLDVTLDGDEWLISGTASVHEGNLHAIFGETPHVITVTPGAPLRGNFEVAVPYDCNEVTLLEPDQSDDEGESASVVIDLSRR